MKKLRYDVDLKILIVSRMYFNWSCRVIIFGIKKEKKRPCKPYHPLWTREVGFSCSHKGCRLWCGLHYRRLIRMKRFENQHPIFPTSRIFGPPNNLTLEAAKGRTGNRDILGIILRKHVSDNSREQKKRNRCNGYLAYSLITLCIDSFTIT